MSPRRIVLAAVVLLAAGCENVALVLPVTCAARDGSVCADLLRVPDGLSAQAACQAAVSPDPVYGSADPCALASLVGLCDATVAGVRMEIGYASPTYTQQTASAACTQLGGTFRVPAVSPPPAEP